MIRSCCFGWCKNWDHNSSLVTITDYWFIGCTYIIVQGQGQVLMFNCATNFSTWKKNRCYWFVGCINWENESFSRTRPVVNDSLYARIWTIILFLWQTRRYWFQWWKIAITILLPSKPGVTDSLSAQMGTKIFLPWKGKVLLIHWMQKLEPQFLFKDKNRC